MRILIAGNLANMGYEIAMAMRKKNVDVTLLLPKFPVETEDPAFMHPELKTSGYPEWLVRFDNHNKTWGLNNWKIQVIREMRKSNYDIIIAMTEFPIFAMFSGKPYAALSTGSDMRELPFEKSLKGFLYNLSYKKAKMIIWGESDQHNLIVKLGIRKKSVFVNVPRNVDFHFQKVDRGELREKFVIFHPVAQDWRIKGNKEFLLAFVKLCENFDNIFLILSNRGPDIENAKKILSDGKASKQFQLIPMANSEQLQYYYNLADVIVDQFVFGSIGMITLEAMKCAKPVLMKIDEKSFFRAYGKIPDGILNVSTADEISNALELLIHDEKSRIELGEKNREWVDKNWNTEVLTERYINICKQLFQNK